MAAIEKLLTMGLAHSPNLERLALGAVTTANRNLDRLGWEEVAQALGALPAHHRAIVALKANPSLITGGELAALVQHLALSLHRFEHTPARTPAKPGIPPAVGRRTHKRHAAILRVALCEYQDPRTCIRCLGKGTVLDHIEGRGMVKGTCGRCEGKGWVRWSDNRRAKAVGGDRNAWTHRYAPSYDHVLGECSRQYRQGMQAFKTVLFGSAEDPTIPGAIERRLQAGV